MCICACAGAAPRSNGGSAAYRVGVGVDARPLSQEDCWHKRAVGVVAIHWRRFGPYHLARLRATHSKLESLGIKMVGLEIASKDDTYGWQEWLETTPYERFVVFPGRNYEQISSLEMWRGISEALDTLDPGLVAISGYNSRDAWGVLGWCLMKRRLAILMSDSKADDAPRSAWREWGKRRVIGQFATALCAGRPHKDYLMQLGMQSERIFPGYDVVDNEYWFREADRARRAPVAARHLPGLAGPSPFFLASARFIPRKNLVGLLKAYASYRKLWAQKGTSESAWRLVILGDGAEKQRILDLIGQERLAGVTLAGFRQIHELPIYYGLAKVFIHPALQEQWGLVVNEAMASGLPVLVSSRCGCVPDLLREGENGFTFDPEDMDALAALMLRMSSAEVDLSAMGRAARILIGDWGTERFADGIYQAMCTALRQW